MCGIVGLFLKDQSARARARPADRGDARDDVRPRARQRRLRRLRRRAERHGQVHAPRQGPGRQSPPRRIASSPRFPTRAPPITTPMSSSPSPPATPTSSPRGSPARRRRSTSSAAATAWSSTRRSACPATVAERFGLAAMTGTHAIGHTRMATELAVTTDGAHPYSTGADQCLVHNGSLSNHNNLRRDPRAARASASRPRTTPRSPPATSRWKMREGMSLGEALKGSLADLDGFYTFVVGTENGFGVLRDGIACKPAVMAETDRYVAFGSEYRALAVLPGIEQGARLGARAGHRLFLGTLMPEVDLGVTPLRELNAALHKLRPDTNERHWLIDNPAGKHAVAAGLDAPVTVEINGSVGYYCAGMNKLATVIVHGNAGIGVAENMMSGFVHVDGRRQPVGRRHRPRRPAPHRRQRLLALRHLDEGHRHRRAGLGRPHERLHGAGRQPRRLRRRRRCARRFDLRGAAVRARRGREPRRRLHREADEGRAQGRAARAASSGPASTGRSIRPSSGATARPASSTISTSTTPGPTDGTHAAHPAAPLGHLRPLHAVGNPPRRGDRHLRHPRRRREAASCRISTISCSSAPRSAATRSKAIARSAAPTSGSAPASPRSRSTSRSRSPSPA